jgi:hypothetical protein
MNPSRRPRADDAGFALPEVLISVLLLATISSVMVLVVSVVLRNAPTTEARSDDARTLQGLVTWLPQDVDSTPPAGFDTVATTPSGCGTSPGINLLRLEWTETLAVTTTRFIANYRHAPVGSAHRIQRITCSGTGHPPFSNASVQNVTSDLDPLPAGWTPGHTPARVAITREPGTGAVTLVLFELTTRDGKTVRIDAAPKNPAQYLPAVPAAAYIPPAPPTGAPLDDISVSAQAGSTVAVMIFPPVTDEDLEVVPMSTPERWSAAGAGMEFAITPPIDAEPGTTTPVTYSVGYWTTPRSEPPAEPTEDPSAELSTELSAEPSTELSTEPQADPSAEPEPVWAEVASGTVSVTILPDCAVIGATVTPTSVRNVNPESGGMGGGNHVNVGVLRDPVTINATTNGFCPGLRLEYLIGAASNLEQFRNMNQTTATTFTVEIPGKQHGSSELWADGTHTIRFFSATGGPWHSVTLTVI